MNDAAGVAHLLRGTALDGRLVRENSGGCLRILQIPPKDVLPAWRAARGVLAETGRWPVFVSDDYIYDELDVIPETDLAHFDRAARSIDPWSDMREAPDEPVADDHLEYFVPTLANVDLVAEVRQQLAAPTMATVNHWVYERLLADPDLLDQAQESVDHLVGTRQWHEPTVADMLLLPTEQPHLAAAWVSFFRTEGNAEVLGAALWEWHQRWGAQLVAGWDTMLQLVVDRRPSAGEEAWELAGQLKWFATHLDADQWEVALAVTRSNEWFLHSRP